MVDTSDEWIMSRIGIKTRHILKGEGRHTSFRGEKLSSTARKDQYRRPELISKW